MNIFPLASDKELNVKLPMICPTLCLNTDHISNILDLISDNFYHTKPELSSFNISMGSYKLCNVMTSYFKF